MSARAEEGNISAKIFVGNLSFRTTKEELTAFLGGAGSIVDVYLPTDRATGKLRGFAFVEFATEAEAKEAIQRYNGQELSGRALRMNPAEERPGGPGGGGGRPSGPPRGGGFGGPREAPLAGPSYFAVDGRESRPKGSRRGVRGKKRSL